MSEKKQTILWSFITGFIIILMLLLRFVFPLVEVNGPSMENTYYDGDQLLTTKVNKNIKRGDVVIAHNKNYEEDKSKLVKRVIAKGGDTIKIVDSLIYVNGKKISEPYIKEEMHNTIASFYEGAFYNSDAIKEDESFGTFVFETKVPNNKLFVMGDNRNISGDSRMFGFFDEDSEVFSKVVYKMPWKVKTFKIVMMTIAGLIFASLIFDSIRSKKGRDK